MSTKKKMIVSISSMCVVLLVAVVSVIAVWAATSASVKSNISITYTIKNIEGSMKMRVAERNSATDSQVTWTSLKTENGSGAETLTFTGEEENISGAFGLGYNFMQWEYTGIQPMMLIEVQMTNSSPTSYFAEFTTGALSGNQISEVYVVRDFFATGTDVVPAVSEYYALYNVESQDKEVVGASGLTTTPYEVKNDGVYCFYLCIVREYVAEWSSIELNFSVALHNAYAGE